MSTALSFVLGSTLPPSGLPGAARALEESGFSRIWLSEDYFFTGGVSGAAVALGATERIQVGIGLLPTFVRHPALSAMEAGTLAGAYPGRFTIGFGSGVKAWLDQIGIDQGTPLAVMRETITSVRELLEGATLDQSGYFTFHGVSLSFPPDTPPPIYIGATGAKMTALAGELADGVLMSVMATPAFIRNARLTVDAASPAGRRTSLTAFAVFSLADTLAEARAKARPVIGNYLSLGATPLTDAAGISADLTALLGRVGRDGFVEAMPDEWIDLVSVCGDPAACTASIEALFSAGADEVALMPVVDSADIVPHVRHAGAVLGLSGDPRAASGN